MNPHHDVALRLLSPLIEGITAAMAAKAHCELGSAAAPPDLAQKSGEATHQLISNAFANVLRLYGANARADAGQTLVVTARALCQEFLACTESVESWTLPSEPQ